MRGIIYYNYVSLRISENIAEWAPKGKWGDASCSLAISMVFNRPLYVYDSFGQSFEYNGFSSQTPNPSQRYHPYLAYQQAQTSNPSLIQSEQAQNSSYMTKRLDYLRNLYKTNMQSSIRYLETEHENIRGKNVARVPKPRN